MNSFTKKAVVALGIAALGFAANAQFAPGQTGTALADQVRSALATSRAPSPCPRAAGSITTE